MDILGIKCGKDTLSWTLVHGETRADATVTQHAELTAPAGERPAQLDWVFREVLEVIGRLNPDRIALRLAQPAGAAASASVLPRAEADGAVQVAAVQREAPCARYYAATVQAAFGGRAGLAAAAEELPALKSTPKSRRDQVEVAVAEFPAVAA